MIFELLGSVSGTLIAQSSPSFSDKVERLADRATSVSYKVRFHEKRCGHRKTYWGLGIESLPKAMKLQRAAIVIIML